MSTANIDLMTLMDRFHSEEKCLEYLEGLCQGRSKFGPLRRSKSRPVGEGVAVFVGRPPLRLGRPKGRPQAPFQPSHENRYPFTNWSTFAPPKWSKFTPPLTSIVLCGRRFIGPDMGDLSAGRRAYS